MTILFAIAPLFKFTSDLQISKLWWVYNWMQKILLWPSVHNVSLWSRVNIRYNCLVWKLEKMSRSLDWEEWAWPDVYLIISQTMETNIGNLIWGLWTVELGWNIVMTRYRSPCTMRIIVTWILEYRIEKGKLWKISLTHHSLNCGSFTFVICCIELHNWLKLFPSIIILTELEIFFNI